MSAKIFVNLPVKDLKRSVDFFTRLGFKFNPRFTDNNAACMIIGENNFVMLLVEPFFKSFIKKEISDAKSAAEVIIAVTAENKAKVDEIAGIALNSGGAESNKTQDEGWMYTRSFQDPDGHLWEIFYMEENAV